MNGDGRIAGAGIASGDGNDGSGGEGQHRLVESSGTVEAGHDIRALSPCCAWGVLVRSDLAGAGAVLLATAGSAVGRHRGLSPVLLSPHLQDQPRVPILPGGSRAEQLAEGRALVGRAPPCASQALRSTGRRSLSVAARRLLRARWLAVQRHRGNALGQDPRLREVSGAEVAQQVLGRSSGRPRDRVSSDCRLAGPVHWLLPEHCPALAQHIPHQLAYAPLGLEALRYER